MPLDGPRAGAMHEPRYLPAPNVIGRAHEDKLIVVDLKSGACFELNSTGRTIWAALERREALTHIAASLSETYGIDSARARADVDTLVDELRRRKLVVVDTTPESP